ncbi:MAG: DNA starvation/stationary phase protection protein [Vicinamibacterales bacterium]
MSTTTHRRPSATAIAKELSAENRAESPLVHALRQQVANAVVLYLNYKHYHWQTHGPHFRDLHRMFDEFADEVLASLDPMAERIRMIGQDPPAHPLEAIELATVSPAAAGSTIRQMVEELGTQGLVVIKGMREAARVADEHDDPGTVDLFSKFVQIHEKHEWWARDILHGGDGLS